MFKHAKNVSNNSKRTHENNSYQQIFVTSIFYLIGTPGQATSYLVGQQVIIEARKNLEEKLGDKFDIKKFHFQILSQSHATLTFIKRYMEHYASCKGGSNRNSCNQVMNKNDYANFCKRGLEKTESSKLNREIISMLRKRIYY